jgi:uncharacterized lipoprotein NlpE involved in copper resistance
MKRTIYFLFIISLWLTACSTSQKAANSLVRPESASALHSAQNSLDWSGTYSGIVPCASCEGIETELRLGEDLTYTLVTKYLGEQEKPYSLSGSFEWQGNNIKLGGIADYDRPTLYKVEENKLRQLDMEGNIITGKLERNYILTKNGNPQVENKKWILTELNGRKVEEKPEGQYIVFHSDKSRIEAKVGCNMLLYDYKIQNSFRLTIYQGISTLMACPVGSLEQEFIEVLKNADNLSVNNDNLSINKARMAPLARFRLEKSID